MGSAPADGRIEVPYAIREHHGAKVIAIVLSDVADSAEVFRVGADRYSRKPNPVPELAGAGK